MQLSSRFIELKLQTDCCFVANQKYAIGHLYDDRIGHIQLTYDEIDGRIVFSSFIDACSLYNLVSQLSTAFNIKSNKNE